MAKLTEDMKRMISETRPALVATASKTGKPNVSAKGSFSILDDEHISFADIRSPRTMANLKENPQVAAIVFNPATGKGCRIWGKAEIISSGDLLERVRKEYATRNMKVNNIVKITVEDALIF